MNDGMGEYVATITVKLMLKKGIQVIVCTILGKRMKYAGEWI